MKYQCKKCKAKGVRLWRQYNCFLDYIKLMCVWCAMRDQKMTKYDPDDKNGAIGWLVAARQAPDDSFWGQTSGPQESVDAWYALPLSEPPKEVP